MSVSDVARALAVGPPAVQVDLQAAADGPVLAVPAPHIRRACELVRDEPEGRYDLLLAIVATAEHVRYQLVSLSHRQRLRLRVALSPDGPAIDSVSFVWPAANWAEREAHDLWGVVFRGHPDPAPLLRGSGDTVHSVTPAEQRRVFALGTRFPTSVDGLAVEIETDGEQVVRATSRLGPRHVGVGAQMARWDYRHAGLLAARVDAFSAMSCDLAYALAVEQLLGVEIPPRADLLRTVYSELQRIASHLFWLARSLQDLADPTFAAPSHVLRAREAILGLFQWLGGNPITPDVIALGGLRSDAPDAFAPRARDLVDDLDALLADMDSLLADHTGLRQDLEDLGVIDRGTALGLGVTGPTLRACGIDYDVRGAFPYAAYGALSLDIATARGSDAWSRFQVRRQELRTSLDLIRQCLSQLAPGAVNALQPGQLPEAIPEGTAYAGVEGPRGELGVLVAADGSGRTPRIHVRGPSFANFSALPYMVSGLPVDRLASLIDSLDLSAGEVAR